MKRRDLQMTTLIVFGLLIFALACPIPNVNAFTCHVYDLSPWTGDNDWTGSVYGVFRKNESTGSWTFKKTPIGFLGDLRYTRSTSATYSWIWAPNWYNQPVRAYIDMWIPSNYASAKAEYIVSVTGKADQKTTINQGSYFGEWKQIMVLDIPSGATCKITVKKASMDSASSYLAADGVRMRTCTEK